MCEDEEHGGGRTAVGKDAIGATLVPELGSFCLARFLRHVPRSATRDSQEWHDRTNLMATVCELSKFVPATAGQFFSARRTEAGVAPSKMTPNEPSPILRPTR
jgi:hypothetical protein